jgi:hypothetical protein
VTDDKKGARVKGQPWSGDAVELFLHVTDKPGKLYTENSFQMIFGPESENAPELASKTKGKWKAAQNQKGYDIEIAIPFEELGLKASEMPGKCIDFDIAIDDSDAEKRENQLIWSGDSKNFNSRFKWGRLHFEK